MINLNTNVASMSAARLLSHSNTALTKSLARLSSGSRIVSPEDDPGGLGQSLRLVSQMNRVSAANTNVSNAVSFSQTQDGFLQTVQEKLDRMSELSVLAQDATKTNGDLSNYQAEFTSLQAYISDVTNKTYNGITLFGSSGVAVTLNADAVTFALGAADLAGAASTGVINAYSGISVSTSTAAFSALNQIKTAIQALAGMRATVGANISRLNLTSEQLTVLKENLAAANSRIADTDIASESAEFVRLNILVQAGTTMLAQANAQPGIALTLLR
ncbi:MAG: flagellin [Verrucomicrobia bacterium]|nr:flagellin [Verrucomicrobiota bacterium]